MRKEVDVDMVACPFHGVDTATIVIEAVTEGGRTAGLGAAAVVTLTGFPNHRAGGSCMHGDGVLGLEGDAFYNVNFAVIGPVGAEHPEGWPDAALGGRTVSDGKNDSLIPGDVQLSRACGQGLRLQAHGCIAWCL